MARYLSSASLFVRNAGKIKLENTLVGWTYLSYSNRAVRSNCPPVKPDKKLIPAGCQGTNFTFSRYLLQADHSGLQKYTLKHTEGLIDQLHYTDSDSIRHFSTTSFSASRSKAFKASNSQTHLGTSQDCKLRRSSIGLNNSILYIDKKLQLKKETRLNIKRHVRSIKKSVLLHNNEIKDKLQDQRAKIRRIKRQLSTKENIKTIPNFLTTLRIASAPVLSYLVLNDYHGYALSIFVLAGFTDMLDGYIARNFKNQRTAFGTALDPFADKLLMSFLTISLTANGLIPVPLTAVILTRDFGLLAASFCLRYISLGPPRTLARYFDFSHVTAKLYPSTISKINTGVQLSFVACTLACSVFDAMGSPWLQMLMYTTGATTILSGADYMMTWRKRLKFIKN